MTADVRRPAQHAEQNESLILAVPSDMRLELELHQPSKEAHPDISQSVTTAEQPDHSFTDISSCLDVNNNSATLTR